MRAEDFFRLHPPSDRFLAEFLRELETLRAEQQRGGRPSRESDDRELKAAAVATLVRLLRKKEMAPFLRLEAAGLLADLGADASDAVSALVRVLDDDFSFIRVAACQALGRIGPAAESAVKPLKELVDDRDPNVQRAAVKALERLRREEFAAR